MFWLLQRMAVSLVLLWVVTTLAFVSINLVPGDPAELLLSGEGGAPDPASVALLREELGLNRPIAAQYLEKMQGLLRLDLGRSMTDGQPVAQEIALRLPRTLALIAAAAVLSLALGLPAGIHAALHRGGRFDAVASLLSGLGQGIPVFVAGTLIILVFAQILQVAPAGGYVPFAQDPLRYLLLLSMPAGAIAIGLAAIVFRIARASVLEVLPLDYVRTARAKGLPPRRITVRHVLPNALMPVITVFALNLGALFGGTVLVEYVFNWPGLSGTLVAAVNARDYPTVTAVVVVISAMFILLNLCVDLLYGIIDPRVRQ